METENTTYNFTEFRGARARLGSNYIGLTGGGAVSFYSGFYKSNNISDFTRCLLLYDKDRQLIAFKFGNDELGVDTFSINHEKNKTAWISSSNFFRSNLELDLVNIKGKFIPQKYIDPQRGEIFIINLNERIEVRKNKKQIS